MNSLQYEYGFGGIEEILNGDVAKFKSQEELDISSSGIILIPKLIGVYQTKEDKATELDEGEIGDMLIQFGIFLKMGKSDMINQNLICVAYDPTIIPRDTLEKNLEGDVLERVKVIEHYNLPSFYEKSPPINLYKNLTKMLFQPNEINKAVLERERDVLRMLRVDYGLTRDEAVDLLAIEIMMIKLGIAPEIEIPRKTKRLVEKFIEITRDFDLDDLGEDEKN